MPDNMTNTRDVIIKLKKVRDEKNLSLGDIMKLMEEKKSYVSKSTLSRVFADGSEDENSFMYETTIRPIANALLDMETIEDTDNMDIQAMKTILQYKIKVIEDLERRVKELETALDKEKIKSHEKLDKEREQANRRIDFLKEQVSLKDKRMDMLLNAVMVKDDLHQKMLSQILDCPCRKRLEAE